MREKEREGERGREREREGERGRERETAEGEMSTRILIIL